MCPYWALFPSCVLDKPFSRDAWILNECVLICIYVDIRSHSYVHKYIYCFSESYVYINVYKCKKFSKCNLAEILKNLDLKRKKYIFFLFL